MEYHMIYQIKDKYFGDDVVFHYTSHDTALKKILPSMNLRFSSFRNVNDPMEKIRSTVSLFWEGSPDFDVENFDHEKYMSDMEKVRLDECKLLCFTTSESNLKFTGNHIFDNDNYYKSGFFKLRMWAQYGENHRGICLAFDKESILNVMEKSYDNKIYHENVKYSDSTLNVRGAYQVRACKELVDNFRDYFIDYHIEQNKTQLYFTKNLDWKDENEYRILMLREEKEDCYIEIQKALKAVFCGIDFPDEDIYTIRELVGNRTVDVYKLSLNNGIPSVERF